MNLTELANIVKSNYKRLQESEIIGRIMLISNRNLERSIIGYKMMKAQNLIPAGFVEPKSEGVLERMITRNPNIVELYDRLGLIPQKAVEEKVKAAAKPIQPAQDALKQPSITQDCTDGEKYAYKSFKCEIEHVRKWTQIPESLDF